MSVSAARPSIDRADKNLHPLSANDLDFGAGSDGSFERAAERFRYVRARCAQTGQLRVALSAGAPARGTRRAVHPALPPGTNRPPLFL